MSRISKRRKFIQQSISLSAGLPFLRKKNMLRGFIRPSDKKLGIALVGLGYYSRDLLAPALQLTNHCELRGIVTGSPDKIPNWKRKYEIKDSNIYNYETLPSIADNDDIDVVYIVTPTALHKKYAVIAAEAGKHVWCEKPMAMNPRDCEAIITACTANDVRLAIGYRVLHEPNMQEIIRLGRDKTFGEITKAQAEAGYRGGAPSGWRGVKSMGGGALYDMGVYTVNGLRHAIGSDPVRVLSARQWTDRPVLFTEVDETTEYKLEFENGIIATGRTSVGENINKLEITCTDGSYYLAPMQTYNGLRGNRSDGVEIYTAIENQQALQMDNDALATIKNREYIATGSDAIKDIAVINAIIESSKKNEPVEIEQY